jgi:hypothetical protein
MAVSWDPWGTVASTLAPPAGPSLRFNPSGLSTQIARRRLDGEALGDAALGLGLGPPPACPGGAQPTTAAATGSTHQAFTAPS